MLVCARQQEDTMPEIVAPTVLFTESGPANTERTLKLAHSRAKALCVTNVLIATSTGATGLLATQLLPGLDLIVVTHSTGFLKPDFQKLTSEDRAALEAAGATVLTAQHAFGGVGRAVRKKLGTYQTEEIIAYTLRTFGEGIKVVAEICLMAADAGLVRTDEPVIAIAGTGRGADTAAIVKPANAQTFFDLRFLEIVCMPAPGHP
jgi:hypothetical protein